MIKYVLSSDLELNNNVIYLDRKYDWNYERLQGI